MEWRIEVTEVSFAPRELVKYLRKMGITAAILKNLKKEQLPGTLKLQVGDCKLLKANNPKLDDAYHISVNNGTGFIAGTNKRSVLFAVYRLLKEMGCRFLRPGDDGEIIPKWDNRDFSLECTEAASYRHRGVCIEGSCSYTHVADLIEWMPKIGMNAYYNQFFVPYTFFEQWYSHSSNPYIPAEPVSVEQAHAMVNAYVEKIMERDMLYHAVGHGWTCEPLGIEGNSWDKKDYHVPEDAKDLLALVGGKRGLFDGIPLNTNLCYSNPIVQEKLVSAIIDYICKHQEVDYLHFWLADGWNNHCECDKCKDTLPSDYFVIMLNEIDRRLAAKDIDTKIVFLIYVDLLWEPQTKRLQNEDRFVLMFAPITRTYTNAYTEASLTEKNLEPYVRNKLVMPKEVGENVQRLNKWKAQFSGDSFVYDYHLIWDHNFDLGGYRSAQVLFEDMKNLDKLGLNGMVSCQVQRVFFPTALGMYAMASALWNKNESFEEVASRYYNDLFGIYGEKMLHYFKMLSTYLDPPYFRGEREIVSEESVKSFSKVYPLVNEFFPLFLEALKKECDPCRKKTWQALITHGQLCLYMARTLIELAKGNTAAEEWDMTTDYINRMEPEIHNLFDVWYFIKTVGRFMERKDGSIG